MITCLVIYLLIYLLSQCEIVCTLMSEIVLVNYERYMRKILDNMVIGHVLIYDLPVLILAFSVIFLHCYSKVQKVYIF